MQSAFVEPGDLNHMQLAFMTLIYGVVLYQASGFISNGSELLQLVPAVAGIVGSIVLPILGAVPDGMMVLFSAVGPDAQETVSVGVGALAGSTVMLLTFPWFICVHYGRVPINSNGEADYTMRDQTAAISKSGIKFQASISKAAKIMLATTFLYFVIQVPASMQESKGVDTLEQAAKENKAALVGLILCILCFCGYLGYCFIDANEDKLLVQVIKGIKQKNISIAAALDIINSNSPSSEKSGELLDRSRKALRSICKPFFKAYDYDHNGVLTKGELKPLIADLGYDPASSDVNSFMQEMDSNSDDRVNFDEFTEYLHKFMLDEKRMHAAPRYSNIKEDTEADEEQEMPEDLLTLTPKQQLRRVIFRSLWMMGLGTALVLIFSDPMVDALSEWGKRLGVSPFYISFLLAPFASNASELLSAYTYAIKRTEKGMTTSLSTLIGAACMNNTFVLAIFLALIWWQQLAWQFTAETVAMVLIQWIIGCLAVKFNTHTYLMGVLILLCYPGCLAVVWCLENIAGLD